MSSDFEVPMIEQSNVDRWKAFTDAEIQALIDGFDGWDHAVAFRAHGHEPHVSLEAELEAEARRRRMPA